MLKSICLKKKRHYHHPIEGNRCTLLRLLNPNEDAPRINLSGFSLKLDQSHDT